MAQDAERTWASPAAAQVWQQGAARRAQTLAVATERMLEAAGLRPGMRVLDVAAGTGDQSLLALQRDGPVRLAAGHGHFGQHARSDSPGCP